MSRSVPWKRICSDNISWRQDQAENATIYILRQTGPTGFLLKEEGENKKFKVYIGDPHTCTCQVFIKEKDLCKHICWILLKKLRVSRHDDISWQHGLVEREINGILRGKNPAVKPSTRARRLANQADQESEDIGTDDGTVPQRPIAQDDVCPICQEELLSKHIPVTFCRLGCGNSVHIKCMKIWGDHQKSTGEKTVKCPFCREDFGSIERLKEEYRNTNQQQTRAERLNQHLGIVCRRCNSCPITGKCYRCVTCNDYHLCQTCFLLPIHGEHSFEFREKGTQRWRPALRGSGVGLPAAVVNNLMSRDITDQDYDVLLQLDGHAAAGSDLTEETVTSFPLERVRAQSRLLAPGIQCRICLQAFVIGCFVRRLPCQHKFHRECIDNRLLHQNPSCPIDGTVYTNDRVRMMMAHRGRVSRNGNGSKVTTQSGGGHVTQDRNITLEIPGIGLGQQSQQQSNTPTTTTTNRLNQRTSTNPRLIKPRSADNLPNLDLVDLQGILQGSMITLEPSTLVQTPNQNRKTEARRINQQQSLDESRSTPNGTIHIPTATDSQISDAINNLPLRPRHKSSTKLLRSRDDSPANQRQEVQSRPTRTWSNHSSRRNSLEAEPQGFLQTRPLAQDSFINHISVLERANNVDQMLEQLNHSDIHPPPSALYLNDGNAKQNGGGTLPVCEENKRASDDFMDGLTALSLLGDISMNQRKPPTGNNIAHKRGKLRSKALTDYRHNNVQSLNDMFVGHDPGSVEGVSSDLMGQRHSGKPPKPPRHHVSADQKRWGEVQQFTGNRNPLVLAGSRCTNEQT